MGLAHEPNLTAYFHILKETINNTFLTSIGGIQKKIVV
jgi:hypothetical protein